MALSIDAVADLAYGAGFRSEALATAVAVAVAESRLDPGAVGDVGIQTPVWGPSIGLWQIRSLKAESGTGKTRDATRLTDPAFNAKSAYAISGGGTNFRPWSVYTAGSYRRHLAAAGPAAAAVASRGGSGSIAGATNISSPGAVSGDVVVASSPLPRSFAPPLEVGEMLIADRPRVAGMAEFVLSAEVEFTIAEAAEVRVVLHNPDLVLFGAYARAANFAKGDLVRWRSHQWILVAIEVEEADGGPQLVLTLRSAEVQKLKQGAAPAMTNVSPTEYAQSLAAARGLRFMGQGSARQPAIGPTKTEAGEDVETPWDVLRRLASEMGYLLYGHEGLVVFAKPSWLVERTTLIHVGWPGQHPDWMPILATPAVRSSLDSKGGDTLRLSVPREVGELVRPGMRILVVSEITNARWIVSRVGWDVGSSEPVTVEAVEAVDPKIAKERPATEAAPTAGPGTPTPTGSSTPAGRRISSGERRTIFGAPGDGGRIVSVATPWGISVSCHREIAPRFKEACEFADRVSRWRPRRIDSLAVRAIRGSSEPSLHSWALAWDFFSSGPGVPPPGGVWAATSAPDEVFRAAFKAKGFFLGADFSSRKDYPHIEWAGGLPGAGQPGLGGGGAFAGAGASGSF